jgi:hypothetical protein
MIVTQVKQTMSIKEFMNREYVRYVDMEILEKLLVISAATFMLQCGAIIAPIISAGLGGI